MGYFANAAVILLDVLFSLLTGLFVMRVLLQLVRANFYNPICQFFYKATNPVLMPLRKVFPPLRSFDTAGSVIALCLQTLQIVLLAMLLGAPLGFAAAWVLGFAGLLNLLLGLYFWLIIARIVISFLSPDAYHPMVPVLMQLTEPVLRPLRRALPMIGPFDLSPLVATLAIALMRVLVVAPLQDFGGWLASGG